MATITRPITFEEFAKLPDPASGRYELYHGELVNVPPAEHQHVRAQWQLRRLLEQAVGKHGFVHTEFPYRPLPENECWIADVVYMPLVRWNDVDRWLAGAPDLVVEVLSPSNRISELRDKRKICLENGCREFWIVDARLHEIEVLSADGRIVIYKSGQLVPLFFAQGASIPVRAIFE